MYVHIDSLNLHDEALSRLSSLRKKKGCRVVSASGCWSTQWPLEVAVVHGKLLNVLHIELEFTLSDSGIGTRRLVCVLAVVESFSACVSFWKCCPLYK